jgi:hypothetical protein
MKVIMLIRFTHITSFDFLSIKQDFFNFLIHSLLYGFVICVQFMRSININTCGVFLSKHVRF